MKRFFLHVGLPRCASTLIENVFHHQRYDGCKALRAIGIKPLPRLLNEFRRRSAIPEWDEDFLAHLTNYYFEPLRGDDVAGYFVSDESLTESGDNEQAPVIVPNRASFLGRALKQYDVRVALIVRRQPEYIVSRYGLHLQNGGTLDFGEFVGGYPLDRLCWDQVTDAFAQSFGEENLVVLPYEKTVHAASGNASLDFFEALQRAIGIPEPVKLHGQPRVNASISPKYFKAQLAINRAEDREAARAESDMPKGEEALYKSESDTAFSPEEIAAMLERFAASNERLFSRFMPAYDGRFYLPGTPT